jgi:hypothetical protein
MQASDPISAILDSTRTESFTRIPTAPTGSTDPNQMTPAQLRAFADSPAGQSLIAFVSSQLTKAQNARQQYERGWYKCLDMYRGEHYTRWMPNQRRMGRVVAPDWDRQPVMNIIRPIIRTEVAKTTSQQPNASVSPATNDEEDIQMAQAGESAWRYQYDQTHFHTEVFQPAEFWRATTGNGFIKTSMDFSEIDRVSTDAAHKQLTAQYPGAEAFIQKRAVYGVIKHEMVTPFHLYVSNMEEPSLQKQQWVMHVQPKPLETARRQFKGYVPEDWTPSMVNAASILDVSRLGDKSGSVHNADHVLIKEAWIKPGVHSALPQGGLVTIVGDQIVYLCKDGIPYAHGEFPFAHLTGISTGLFYRESVIRDLISPQQELNLTYAQIIKAKNLASKPQMFYQAGALTPSRITSKPGLYIEVIQGFDFPKPVPMQDLPGYVQSLPAQLRAIMEDISGQHDVSRGESPTSGASATMIAYLGERDDSYLSEVFKGIEAAVETCARQFLSLAVQYWDEPRLVKIVGNEAGQDAKMLKGADIGSGTDIRVEAGSALPISKAARIALITEWMKLGFITVDQGFKALQMGMVDQLLNTIRQDEAQAQRENIRMKDIDPVQLQMHQLEAQMNALQPQIDPMTGQPAQQPPLFPVNEFDNHAVHMEVHGRFMKSQSYETMAPEQQEVYLEHWRAHRAMVQQQAMQQVLGGMPPEGGSPTAEPGAQQNVPAFAGVPQQ